MVMMRDGQLGVIDFDTILTKGAEYAQKIKTVQKAWKGEPKPKQVTVVQPSSEFQITPAILIGGTLLLGGTLFLLAKKKRG